MIDYVINNLTNQSGPYVFYKNHPIDIRNRKYKVWRKMFNEGVLQCHCCKSKVTEIRLVKCKGDGSIYKPGIDGSLKHNFKLFGEGNEEMTLDHWIPKSFLRRWGLNWNMMDNLVLMCKACNKFKSDIIPYNWKEIYNSMDGSTILPKHGSAFSDKVAFSYC